MARTKPRACGRVDADAIAAGVPLSTEVPTVLTGALPGVTAAEGLHSGSSWSAWASRESLLRTAGNLTYTASGLAQERALSSDVAAQIRAGGATLRQLLGVPGQSMNFISYHECRIKPYSKLPNQVRVFFFISSYVFKK